MVNIIKEETIEDLVKILLSDILEYDNIVNKFFLPVLKSKLDNPKQELEKELQYICRLVTCEGLTMCWQCQ